MISQCGDVDLGERGKRVNVPIAIATRLGIEGRRIVFSGIFMNTKAIAYTVLTISPLAAINTTV